MDVSLVCLLDKNIRLEPLDLHHADQLGATIAEGDLRTCPFTVVPSPDEMESFISKANQGFQRGEQLAFVIVDRLSGQVVGCTSLKEISLQNKRAEIGLTLIGPKWQNTTVYVRTARLLLSHGFCAWNLNRIEMRTDALNAKARAAIGKLGAVEEGILRDHQVMQDGRIRSTVVYSITRTEWPASLARLSAAIAGSGRE